MGDFPLEVRLLCPADAGGPVVARIVAIDTGGRPTIAVGAATPLPARCAVGVADVPPRDRLVGAEVVVVFQEGDATRPVIVGFVRDRLWADSELDVPPPLPDRVEIAARQEVVLHCGDSSISLSADGRVVIKGRRLTSRASETHRILGAVVLIN